MLPVASGVSCLDESSGKATSGRVFHKVFTAKLSTTGSILSRLNCHIETLASKGVIGAPQIVEYLDSLGRPASEYQIGERDSYIIVAQLSPEFTARLVDRWQELETQTAPQFAIPQNLSQALRLAADLSDQKAQAEAAQKLAEVALAVATPKAQALDRISASDGTLCFTDAAKELKTP